MKQKLVFYNTCLLLLIFLVIGINSCKDDESTSPTLPIPEDGIQEGKVADYYVKPGLGTGRIAIYLNGREFVLNLPAGVWKISYQVDGVWYAVAVVSDEELLHYIETDGIVTDIKVERGEYVDGGWLSIGEPEIWVIVNGGIADGIDDLEPSDLYPPTPVPPTPVPPTPGPNPFPPPGLPDVPCLIDGPVSVGGYNWYWGCVNMSCNDVCGAVGLSYDEATRDFAGGLGYPPPGHEPREGCRDVVVAFGHTFRYVPGNSCTGGYGCTFWTKLPNNDMPAQGKGVWCASPETNSYDRHHELARYCACR